MSRSRRQVVRQKNKLGGLNTSTSSVMDEEPMLDLVFDELVRVDENNGLELILDL